MRKIAIGVAALVLAGCGGGPSNDDYRGGYERIGAELESAEAELESTWGPAARTTDGALIVHVSATPENAKRLTETLNSYRHAIDDLEELEPPGEIEDAHDGHIAALRQTLEETQAVLDLVAAGNLMEAGELVLSPHRSSADAEARKWQGALRVKLIEVPAFGHVIEESLPPQYILGLSRLS